VALATGREGSYYSAREEISEARGFPRPSTITLQEEKKETSKGMRDVTLEKR